MEKDNSSLKMDHTTKVPSFMDSQKDKDVISSIMDASIKVKYKITKQVVKAHTSTLSKNINIMANGLKTNLTATPNKNLLTVPIMRANSYTESNKVTDIMSANQEYIKGNLNLEILMEKALSITQTTESIKDNGSMDYSQDMVSSAGQMEIDMKDNIKTG